MLNCNNNIIIITSIYHGTIFNFLELLPIILHIACTGQLHDRASVTHNPSLFGCRHVHHFRELTGSLAPRPVPAFNFCSTYAGEGLGTRLLTGGQTLDKFFMFRLSLGHPGGNLIISMFKRKGGILKNIQCTYRGLYVT